MSEKLPSREQALQLLREHQCAMKVINHCKAVTKLALETANVLKERGLKIDSELVEVGALLHDIGRSKTHTVHHAVVGAEIAKSAGLPEPDYKMSELANKTEIFAYAWQATKDGKAKATIETYTRRLKQLSKTCNLLEPEQVKETIANGQQQNGTKRVMVNAYSSFLKFKDLKWQKPIYKTQETLPFIPLEKEIDELIASTSKTISIFLQYLKETGARTTEATRAEWIDLDTERKLIKINHPAKGSNPRILPITQKLIGMINNLTKKEKRIFTMKPNNLRTNFDRQRTRASIKLNNPRLKQISFHTLRHWKGTTEYHKTQNIYYVMKILGHKDIRNTLIYINLEQTIFTTQNDEYHSATATTIQEAQKLIETGFEYITEIDKTKLFRKRK